MRHSRAVSRTVSLVASVVLFVTAPAGIAMAKENGHGPNPSPTSAVGSHGGQGGLTDAQQAALDAARATYLASVQTARTTFTTTVDSIRAATKADLAPFDSARNAARAAYVNAVKTNADAATIATLKAKYEAASAAFRTALTATKSKYQTQFDAAAATAKSALSAATATYANSVKAVFAPGTPPRNLLNMPNSAQGWLTNDGQNYGWLLGHLHDADDD